MGQGRVYLMKQIDILDYSKFEYLRTLPIYSLIILGNLNFIIKNIFFR